MGEGFFPALHTEEGLIYQETPDISEGGVFHSIIPNDVVLA
jgi:hypothetical protein